MFLPSSFTKNKKASININFTNPDTGLPVDLTGLRFDFAKHNYNDRTLQRCSIRVLGPITGITKVDPKNGWARIEFCPRYCRTAYTHGIS